MGWLMSNAEVFRGRGLLSTHVISAELQAASRIVTIICLKLKRGSIAGREKNEKSLLNCPLSHESLCKSLLSIPSFFQQVSAVLLF